MRRSMISVSLIGIVGISLLFGGCKTKEEKKVEKKPALEDTSYYNFDLENSTLIENYKVALLSETGKDETIFKSAEEGLKSLSSRLECEIDYETYDSSVTGDYEEKVKLLVEDECKMIWVLGTQAENINIIAEQYPNVTFSVVNEYYDEILKNVILVNFKESEEGFLAGYTAALSTQTNKVAIMYSNNEACDEYRYGYKAGVYYANNETSEKVEIAEYEITKNATKETIINEAKALVSGGADIIYVTCDDYDDYVIDALKGTNAYAIAANADVDLESANLIAYTEQLVNSSVELISFHAMSGNDIAGVSYEYGISESALDLKYIDDSESVMLAGQIGNAKEMILGGAIEIPVDEAGYNEFVADSVAE